MLFQSEIIPGSFNVWHDDSRAACVSLEEPLTDGRSVGVAVLEGNSLRLAVITTAPPISPSQVHPVELHRLHAGLASSHFTFQQARGNKSRRFVVQERMKLNTTMSEIRPSTASPPTSRLPRDPNIQCRSKCT